MKYFSPNAKLVSTYHTSTANVIGDQPIGAIGRNIRKNPIALPLLVSEVGISGFIQALVLYLNEEWKATKALNR